MRKISAKSSFGKNSLRDKKSLWDKNPWRKLFRDKVFLKYFAITAGILILLAVIAFAIADKDDRAASVDLSGENLPTPKILPTNPPPASTSTPTPTPAPLQIQDLDGLGRNVLNGYYIDEKIAQRRPVAVVINNLKKALPQSGISQADLYYEVLSEGDITRIIAVFQDFNSEKIGPVRSARHYFLNFAADNDAVFVHHGGSSGVRGVNGAYEDIVKYKINNIDGMKYEGVAFWRDPIRIQQRGMSEHSSYTSADKILAQAEKLNYRLEKSDDYKGMFGFYDDFTSPGKGQTAETVKVPFAKSLNATFVYDSSKRIYNRFEFNEEHIDEETGNQLSVTNVLVQFAEMYEIKNDEAGRRDVKLIGSGKGFLITGGKASPVAWSKESFHSPTKWLDEAGNTLTLNKGKTWICVTDTDYGVTIE